MTNSPTALHVFWFSNTLDSPEAAKARNAVWFGSSPAFDAECRRFEPTMAAAARGERASWESDPRSCVSLVIALDQLPRNVYRSSAAAFAHDALALAVTRRAVAASHLDALSIVERAFLLMPYQHVEDAERQREGLRHFERLHGDAPAAWREFTANTLRFARLHFDIVERFGRFPHRNAILGRTSTDAEKAYLASKPDTFGQGA
jgi:uncharacterized protein (DUF924 family)